MVEIILQLKTLKSLK